MVMSSNPSLKLAGDTYTTGGVVSGIPERLPVASGDPGAGSWPIGGLTAAAAPEANPRIRMLAKTKRNTRFIFMDAFSFT
jgi:hypothetical protein